MVYNIRGSNLARISFTTNLLIIFQYTLKTVIYVNRENSEYSIFITSSDLKNKSFFKTLITIEILLDKYILKMQNLKLFYNKKIFFQKHLSNKYIVLSSIII